MSAERCPVHRLVGCSCGAMRPAPCPTCGEPTAPLDWESPGGWYHVATGLLFCSGGNR